MWVVRDGAAPFGGGHAHADGRRPTNGADGRVQRGASAVATTGVDRASAGAGFIDAQPDAITLGGATTFADLRRSPEVLEVFPLLVQAASWTGSIANQSRAALADNLCNSSPAADSPTALLLYEPELT